MPTPARFATASSGTAAPASANSSAAAASRASRLRRASARMVWSLVFTLSPKKRRQPPVVCYSVPTGGYLRFERSDAPMTLITTPFGWESTAAYVVDGISLAGKNAIVTGGASGIGIETARALARAGAAVTIGARNAAAAQRATVNNAGVMALPELRLTAEGWETQFATNHLGHFALTLGLHDALAEAGNARVVNVSSSGHLQSPIVFDDIHYAFRPYDPWTAYGQSKTANVLFSVEITKRWADDGISSNALMPGGIMTNLQRHLPKEALEALLARAGSSLRIKTPAQGAATSVLLATSPQLEGIGGRHLEGRNEGN